jgi:hypothetical protein
MRRFLTLICLLGLALPAGISLSGCVRNPAGKYCNGLGYGITDTQVSQITLQPQIAGISLAYGQTTQIQTPTAATCKGTTASVSSTLYSYGTTNNQLVDISPTGSICAGTWNRNTGGGIANYTYCYYPNPLPTTNGLPYGIAYITATAESVTSNPVAVYVHAPVTSISLVTTSLSSSSSLQCFSQSQTAQLDAQACYVSNGTQYEFCAPSSVTANYACQGGLAPGVTSVPSCGSSIGTLNFSVGTSSVGTINATTNVITAEQPGTTAITATIAQSASSAGYFSTCPPASISVSLANGSTKGVVTQGVTQNLTTSVTDTQGNTITGLLLTYQSTNPIDITTGSSGSITAAYPGVASINAVCEPPSCNPAPINEMGLNGTGLSISSNPVNIIVPGTTSDYAWFGSPGQSQYFYSMELLTGNPGSTVRLPYVPNSMLMDREGNSLYFGSAHELMIYSTATNSLTTQNTSVPGVVLAVSPNAGQLLINDQIRGLFYLYNISGSSYTTFGGLGNAAAWTADSQTLYITDNANLNTPSTCSTPLITGHTNTLYVYSANSGWSTYPLPPSPLPPNEVPACDAQPNNAALSAPFQTPAVTIPGVGAYMRGNPTVAHTWCPGGLFPSPPNVGVVGNNASISFYPQPVTDSEPIESDALAATTDGDHILSAALNSSSITLNDIGVSIPPTTSFPAAECPVNTAVTPQTMTPLSTNPSLNGHVNLTGVTNATAVNQVVTGAAPTTASVTTAAPIAFITYNAPNTPTIPAAQLPYYLPQPNGSGAGPAGYVTFNYPSGVTATATAPLAGSFSPDNSIFFVSTQGDNEIHFISIPINVSTTAPTDMQQVSPDLPACMPVSAGGDDAGCLYNGTPTSTTYVPATVVTVKPRSVT